MRIVMGGIAGGAVALFCVAVTGILSIQGRGTRVGGVYTLMNDLVAVRAPSLPMLQYVGMAVLASLCFFVVHSGTARFSHAVRMSGMAGFVITGLGLIVWAQMIERGLDPGLQGPRANAGGGVVPVHGPLGWIHGGGSETSVHAVIAIVIVFLISGLVSRRSGHRPSTEESSRTILEEPR